MQHIQNHDVYPPAQNLNEMTLKQIMDRADTLHNMAFNLTLTMPMKRLTAATLELQTYIKSLQVIAQHIAQISNFITRVIHRKSQVYTAIIDLIPHPGDYAVLNILRQPIPWQLTQQPATQPQHSTQIPFVNVQCADDIPISYIYYVNQNIEQFKDNGNDNHSTKELYNIAININGYIIDGLPGRIGYGLPQSVMCKIPKCKTNCTYWHMRDNHNENHNESRNFTPDAWKTTSYKSKAGTQRLTGSIDTLNYDIQNLTQDELNAEIDLRKSQLIHDMYVFLTLCNAQKFFKNPKNIC